MLVSCNCTIHKYYMHVDVIASVEIRKKQQHSKTNEITQQYEIVIASNVTN